MIRRIGFTRGILTDAVSVRSKFRLSVALPVSLPIGLHVTHDSIPVLAVIALSQRPHQCPGSYPCFTSRRSAVELM